MSATNNFETSLLNLILNNVSIADIADGITPDGDLYVSLHEADPGEAGDQSTSESGYTSYARVAVSRAGSAWTVSGNEAKNATIISFPIATGGASLITHFGIGTASTGSGVLLLKGELTASLSVANGIRPIFDISDLKILVD